MLAKARANLVISAVTKILSFIFVFIFLSLALPFFSSSLSFSHFLSAPPLRSLFGATANRSSQCLACHLRSPDPNPIRTPNPTPPPTNKSVSTSDFRGPLRCQSAWGVVGLTRSLRGLSSNPPPRTRSKNPVVKNYTFLFIR